MKRLIAGLGLLFLGTAAWAARTRLNEGQGGAIDWTGGFFLPNDEPDIMKTPQAQKNLSAFLEAIIDAEGTRRGGVDPFGTVYSYAFRITDFSDHPANKGWRGVTLPDRMCSLAGLGPGCVSTAAGAYQINKGTWNGLKKKISLPDFSPESQNLAAVQLIRERGALADIHAGRFDQAIAKCARTWASLPGAGYGQPEKKLAQLQAVYANAGGVFA